MRHTFLVALSFANICYLRVWGEILTYRPWDTYLMTTPPRPVEYLALRACGEPDAVPASDLAQRRACAESGEAPSERAVEELAEPFRPFRAYAAMHLWTSLSSP